MTLATLAERLKLGYSLRQGDPSSSAQSSYEGEDAVNAGASGLLDLPSEILDQILAYLTPQTLVSLNRTCRKLSHHASKDILWAAHLRRHLPPSDFPETPAPAPNYRALYLSHHPYWFLPQHALWFSDEPYNGNIVVVRFDPRRGCIEGYRLLGEKNFQGVQQWSYMPNVSIHNFKPRMKLWLDQPSIRLAYEPDLHARSQSKFPWDGEIRFNTGLPSVTGHNTAVSATFFLALNIDPRWQNEKMQLWPPRIIPGLPRVRSSHGDTGKFRGPGHKPQNYSQISETSFRMRFWTQFHVDTARFGVRIGEEVTTWSTLPKALYTPTPEKPYQGIWVGDYAGHGCEILLVVHTPTAPPLPARRESSNDLYGPILGRDDDDDSDGEFDEAMNGIADPSPNPHPSPFGLFYAGPPQSQGESSNVKRHSTAHAVEPGFSGALQAIKLTGDVNVPRGQHTFIADDLGPRGYIRHATESPFAGARIVHSRGHVAGRGFVDDAFVPSQLIMISHDLLAQYWVNMGHISYYRRVDLDAVIDQSFGEGTATGGNAPRD